MLRKIAVKELKVGDVYALEKRYLYPHVVTRIDSISWSKEMISITSDYINKANGYCSQECVEVLGKEVEIYRFII